MFCFVAPTCSCVFPWLLIAFPFPFWIVVTLTATNALISALEAELNASREAWEGANAAKVVAEKVAK
jgi:hypothetical protein